MVFDEKQLEEKFIIQQKIIEEQKQELLIAKARQTAILDNIPYSAWLKDASGKIISANELYKKFIFTISGIDDVIGCNAYNIYSKEVADQIVIDENEVLESKKTSLKLMSLVVDNIEKWLEVFRTPIFDDSGNSIGISGLYRDITIQKLYESELKKSREVALTANKVKSEFLANMSHEIRTPMNAILGFTNMLLDKVEDIEQKKYLTSIKNSGNVLLDLINDILDLSKIEANKLTLQYSEVLIRNLLQEIFDIFSFKIQEKNILMEIIIDSNIPNKLIIDQIRLRQILFNLIGNAIKFTDKGKVSILIQGSNIQTSPMNLDLIIEIKDTGVGIKEDQQKLIFEAFRQQQGQSYRKYGGTGLGLSITKKLIQIMGGTISLASELGFGSNFKVILNQVDYILENNENTTIIDSSNKAQDSEIKNYNNDNVKDFTELIKILNEELFIEWEEIFKSMIINRVIQFSERLKNLGKEYSNSRLLEYSNELETTSKSFNRKKTQDTLKKYPEILKNIMNGQKYE